MAALLLFSNLVHAKYTLKAKAQPNRLTLHFGYSDQAFAIPSGADFDHIKTNYLGLGIERRRSFYTFGLQYFSVGPVDLKSFWINSTNQGKYQITFERYQVFAGVRTERVRYLLVGGIENSKWSGSPGLGMKRVQFAHYGLMWVYDAFAKSAFHLPVMVTVLSHPGRKYEFSNFPSATIEASRGVEVALGMGVAFGF